MRELIAQEARRNADLKIGVPNGEVAGLPPAQHLRNRNGVIQQLSESRIYRDYQRAFTRGTGLPLGLQKGEWRRLISYPTGPASPFCALLCGAHRACAACYAFQQKLETEGLKSRTLRCFAGLCESAVPVRVGQEVIAFLHTGQVLLQPPTRRQFNHVAHKLLEWGAEVDLDSAEEAYFQTRVLQPRTYRSLVGLLEIFAEHLASSYERLRLRAKTGEPPAVTKARQFITDHHQEPLSLPQISRTVNLSATQFSRCFKAAAGMTFIEYLAHVRVEKAKQLLQNPAVRITEVALEVGFRSISQFNRTFKKITGLAPREFRTKC